MTISGCDMSRIIDIPSGHMLPSQRSVLSALGVPEDREPEPRVLDAVDEALDLFVVQVEPRGILADVSEPEFERIYRGRGDNAVPSPLASVFPRADALELFAATAGAGVSEEITSLFDSKKLSLAVSLDAVASVGTELAGEYLDRISLARARDRCAADDKTRALRYSPGYCGWHLSGQDALFAALQPEEIGIRLSDSYLMEPLKSISGVIVLGPAEIHAFEDSYAFCSECRTRDCRKRIADLRERPNGSSSGASG
jgi:hypothetical protein